MDTAMLAPPCAALRFNVCDDGATLAIHWANDGTVSKFCSAWLAEHLFEQLPPIGSWTPGSVDDCSIVSAAVPAEGAAVTTDQSLRRLKWATVTGSDHGLLQWLEALSADGMCLITDAPVEAGCVVDLASSISHPQPTIYGTSTFDVVSVPEPINIAYSPLGLPLHQDLVYYESPPGLQLLHCIDFADTVRGGESTLLDGAALLADFRVEYPHHFQTLCTIPTLFQKVHYDREEPVHMTYHRPILSVNAWGHITQFTWAPPFEGPLPNYGPKITRAYYAAYSALAEAIDSSPSTIEFRLRPGDIVSFNNRRVLHGRRAFESMDGLTPRRHLQGTYVNIDDFKNKHQVLERTLYEKAARLRPRSHVWNQDGM
mmetsp:Transcript_11138/g.33355  ORF Transcript_11138/g.33355 Transcript_11138/m.33355 type:complete len:371 (+) Transcript_11138:777-1889(+)